MKFLSVRELREKSAQVWKDLAGEKEMVVTSNGRPIALLSSIDEKSFELSIAALRRARAIDAVTALQVASAQQGANRITAAEIESEIKAARKSRR